MTGSIHKINALTQNTFYDSARNSTFKNFLISTKTVLDFNPYEKVLAAGLGNVKNKIKPGEVSLSQLQQAGASATKYVDTLINHSGILSEIIDKFTNKQTSVVIDEESYNLCNRISSLCDRINNINRNDFSKVSSTWNQLNLLVIELNKRVNC